MKTIIAAASEFLRTLPFVSWLIEAQEEFNEEWHAWEKPTGRFLETEFVMRRMSAGRWIYRPCTKSELEEASWDRTEKNAGW